jgi:hypothetical protein
MATPESLLIQIEHDDASELATPAKRLSLSICEFVEDFKRKIPSNVTSIDMFVFIDKTDIINTERYTKFTFVPARINLLESRKSIGFVSVGKLLAIYGPSFKLSAFESQWSKLIQTAEVNVIRVNLKPKTSKSGHEYYNMDILAIDANNTKAIETLTQYYDEIPRCKYQRSTVYNDENAFGDDVTETYCGV